MRCVTTVLTALVLSVVLIPPRPLHAQSTVDTVALDIEQAMRRALDASPEVGAERASRDFADARRRLALASRFFTEFTATTAHSVAPGLDIPEDNTFPRRALYLNPDVRNDWEAIRPFNRIEFELTQPIFTWGQLGGSIRAARHGVDVESAEVGLTEQEVALRTGQLYFGLQLAEALLRLTADMGDVVERARREITRLLDEGAEDVDYADLYQLQITEQEYHRRVVEVERRRIIAERALSRQLMLPDGTVASTGGRVLTPVPFQRDSLAVYLSLGLQQRGELAQAAAGIAARSALVEVARSDYFPKLFMVATGRVSLVEGRQRQPNPYISDPYVGRAFRAGIGLRQTLNFAQTRARVDQARAEREEVVQKRRAAEQLVQFEIEEAYNNLIIAEAALEAQNESLRLSNEWLQTESINFDLGLGDTENLVDAVRTNLELQVAYFDAVNRYNVAVLRLLNASGILTSVAGSGTLVE